MSQSRLMSLVEAAANVTVGYGLAVGTQIVVFPHFGFHPSLRENLTIGLVFLSVSLARSYVLRRVFEGEWRRKARKLVPVFQRRSSSRSTGHRPTGRGAGSGASGYVDGSRAMRAREG